MENKFDITGMTCSACSARVEKAVKKLDGIEEVSVNLLTNNMKVKYNEEILNREGIIQAVEKAGYGASLHNSVSEQTAEKSIKSSGNIQSQLDLDAKLTKKRLVASICFLIPLLYISMYHMVAGWFGISDFPFMVKYFHGAENSMTFAFTQFILLLPILYLNQKYFINGFKSLYHRSPNMDSLIAIGAGAATVYGVFAIFKIGYGLGHGDIGMVERYSMDLYFESAGTILTLITIGKYLESKSKGRTSEAITKLINLSPRTAFVEREGTEKEIPAAEVVKGDIVIVKPGGSIPVDGIITEGASSIDEAAITGESIPVFKTVGDKVVSATINKNGSFKFEAVKVGDDTTLAQIIKLVEEASSSKAPIAKLADKISGIFVPVVIGIAVTASAIWLAVGASFEFSLSIGIAVLVISCPCALGLATPVAIMVGTGKGAEKGILIKSGEALETAHNIDTVVLDKTGTITEGKPKVTDIKPLADLNEAEILKIAGAIEKHSEHPLAEAVINEVRERKLETYDAKEFQAILGKGAEAQVEGRKYFLGNKALLEEKRVDITKIMTTLKNYAEEGKTPLIMADEERPVAVITVMDTIKADSRQAVEEFNKMGIDVIMLTGDNKVTAEAIKLKTGIKHVIAEVLPEDKENKISQLKKEGHKVAMIGDGINDAPALVSANVGIAIGAGTDVAIESADIVLMKSSLLDAVTAIKLSRAVIKNIKENLFWAFFYNSIGIPLAAGVLFTSLNLKLNPMFGAAAMSLSSVCVVLNALRLKLFNVKYDVNIEKTNLKPQEITEKTEESKMIKIKIEGMSCGHCTGSVEKVLNKMEGITVDHVSLEDKAAYVEGNIDAEAVRKAIEEEGFEVTGIE